MTAVPFLSRKDVLRVFAPYGCGHVEDLQDGLELWRTKSGHYFTLCPEDPAGDGDFRYDFWQIQRALANVIVPTMSSTGLVN